MFTRFRLALGLTLLLTLLTSVTVFAKGSFAFITITGPNLKEPIRSTDPALTTDFFAFADFTHGIMKVPTNPGVGYEVTRYYNDGGREAAFDHLHYYPETGYVYFDGLVNGSSEYDGKWYPAKPEIKDVFFSALAPVSTVKTEPQTSNSQSQPAESNTLTKSALPISETQSITLVSVIAGLVVIGVLAYRRRRSLAH
jgi:hypothetical protein